ncbi:hypothetical protein PG991_002596 [Apiospora marii]|uniref:Uncharacterized protein n=1 Tax=Apiospora marii TaxID=335849 RepID=A0ABR1SI74_9PEZI
MRLRASNKQKRFRTSDYIPTLGSSDDEADGAAKAADEDTNDAFINPPGAEDDDDDDVVEPDLTSDSDNPPSNGPKDVRIRPRRSVVKSKLHEPETERPPGEVQPYPSDPASRWTRAYVGPVTRWSRFPELCQYWFDDRTEYQKVIDVYLSMWAKHELLPPRLLSSAQLNTARSPWMPSQFPEDQENSFLQWYIRHLSGRAGGQKSTLIPHSTAWRWYLPQTDAALVSLLGPFDDLKEYTTQQGQSITLATNSLPVEDESPDDGIEQGGFLLDVGGIVMSMGWAPLKGHGDQLLAMSVIPFADQAYYSTPEEAPKQSSLEHGSVQIWHIQIEKTDRGTTRPSRTNPRLAAALCFDWGRVVRMQWCPVPLPVDDHISLLAVLCSDGRLRVIEVRKPQLQGSNATYEEIQEPLALMEIRNEKSVEISCFTWINTNRIATGLTDGSVIVWSISPCRVLQRHPIHSSPVMDISSSYPSHPFVIATLPVGGVATITDLMSTCEVLSACGPLPSLPAAASHSCQVAYFHKLDWYSPSMANPPALLWDLVIRTSWSALRMVPLWIVNVFRKVTFYRKASHKLKLFQHEYQEVSSTPKASDGENAETAPRGVCRILHGFRPLHNGHPKASRGLKMRQTQIEQTKNRKKAKAASAKKKGRGKDKNNTAQDNDALEEEDASRAEDQADGAMPSGEIAVYAPLSRITSACWNSNVDFSWWAAAAMGSGLVRIMDLGVDMKSGHRPAAGGDPEEDPGLDIGQDFQADEDMEDAEDDFGEGEILGDEGPDDTDMIGGGGWTAVNSR